MRDHCALSSNSAYALCVCALRGPFVICAEPVDRLPVNQTDKETDQADRLAARQGDGRPESWKAGQPSVLATFRGCKIMSNQFQVGRGCKTATIATTKLQPNENLSAKNSFGQGIYCGATG